MARRLLEFANVPPETQLAQGMASGIPSYLHNQDAARQDAYRQQQMNFNQQKHKDDLAMELSS